MLTQTDINAISELLAYKLKDSLTAQQTVDKWLTFEEAMAYAKVKSRTTFKKWIDDGSVYAIKPEGSWRIDRDSIDDFFYMENKRRR